ncbi:DNA mismatch repair protein MLH1 [Zea mays]|uniref:DNA mismatch repair protein MLH1 n=1 Tax=Zea mays TaxID=4577 RepID=A0A1D6L6D4_MAIZE|nr:DNA mismatch repair protein MLH1 [Zea mays]ONM09864.1 DNA mismatch repair protein MLH1 [Zea mays]
MASWDNLGELSNIAQLTGLDAVKLISLIVRAASTARLHKRNCRRFAQHLKLIGGLLEQLRVSELRKYPETPEPLEQLEDALRRGYLLVNSCQDHSYLYLLAMGWNIIYQFRKAQSEIDNYLCLVPLITLVWFHAVSLGEGMVALPVVRHCVRLRPGLPVLFTTTTLSSSEVIMNLLPDGVIYQFAPLDCPTAIDSFFGYWKPSLVLLLKSELWPNLIMSAAAKGLSEPAPLQKLLLMALKDYESIGDENDEEKLEIAEANSKILKENAEMINEYFSIHVDHDGNLTRLPVVLDQYTPDMDRLPNFVLTMGNDVTWDDEKECFRTAAAAIGNFYALHPPILPNPSGSGVQVYKKNKACMASGEHVDSTGEWIGLCTLQLLAY